MKFEEHCQESVMLCGAPFTEVHQWLDEFAGTPGDSMRHRRARHHEAGIREAVHLFGEAAAAAARQHIISDLKIDGWTEHDPFPNNEAHYVKMESQLLERCRKQRIKTTGGWGY